MVDVSANLYLGRIDAVSADVEPVRVRCFISGIYPHVSRRVICPFLRLFQYAQLVGRQLDAGVAHPQVGRAVTVYGQHTGLDVEALYLHEVALLHTPVFGFSGTRRLSGSHLLSLVDTGDGKPRGVANPLPDSVHRALCLRRSCVAPCLGGYAT